MRPRPMVGIVLSLALTLVLASACGRRAETETTAEPTVADPANAPLTEADLEMVVAVDRAMAQDKLKRVQARREIGRALAEGRPFVATTKPLTEDDLARQLGYDPPSYRRAELRMQEATVDLQLREERLAVQRFRAVELDIFRARLARASDPKERADLSAIITEVEAAATRDAQPPTPDRQSELTLVAAHLARSEATDAPQPPEDDAMAERPETADEPAAGDEDPPAPTGS